MKPLRKQKPTTINQTNSPNNKILEHKHHADDFEKH